MKVGERVRYPATLVCAIGLLLVFGCGRVENVGRRSGPKLVVTTQSEEPAKDNSGSRMRSFVLANQGDEELRFGEASASCGCTSATVTPNVVPPGGTATLSARGQPPTTGSTTVRISVATNDASQPTLTLIWDLTGNPDPPKLVTPAPIVELGILRPGRSISPRSFAFDVLEKREGPPIVQSVRFDPAFCQVEGGMIDEKTAKDARFVIRSYLYNINFLSVPEQGNLTQQIDLHKASDESAPWFVVPVRGRVLPIVRAVPSSIPLVDRKTDPTASAKMMILCDDQSGPLQVDCVDRDPATVVRIVERRADRVFYEVYQEEVGDRTAVRRLRFQVSQPVTTTLEVSIQARNPRTSPP